MDRLHDLQKYEDEHGRKIADENRPAFHLSPQIGWLNDPNGFSQYKGIYHLFYQYNPYGTRWDYRMNWGHWTSSDLIHWKFEKAALAPDQPYEDGVFSGSAITDKDGSHLLMYTAHYEKEEICGQTIRRETQCLARGDGENYIKLEGNPVIDEKDLPDYCDERDFRDPKIWLEDGTYYAVIAARNRHTKKGMVILYASEDARKWSYKGILEENKGALGTMWECPDFFSIKDKNILTVAAMGVRTDNPVYRNGFTTFAFVGEYDSKTGSFTAGEPQGLDLGFDFYAPQSMETADGRRILVAWMQAPESGGSCPEEMKWFGMMTFPREISIRKGILCQNPIEEIRELYVDSVFQKKLAADAETEFEAINGRLLDLTVTVHEREDQNWENFSMKFASNGKNYVRLTYRKTDGHLIVDRRKAGRSASLCDVREVDIGKRDTFKVRLLLDRFSFELFVNDGEKSLTGTIYELPLDAEGLSFEAAGAEMDIEKHAMKAAPVAF